MLFDMMFVCKNENKIIGLDSLVFHHREDFYNYMRPLEGFTVPEPTPAPALMPDKQQEKKKNF
jgi:hypothetical protein